MSSRQSNTLISVDFFTTTHRISGSTQAGVKPLSDQLNDRSQSYLLVSNVYVSQLDDPGAIGAHAPVAYLSKENLAFAILPAREARIPESGGYARQTYEALATLPGFEIRGSFVGPRRFELRSFSPATLDPFLVLTNATAQSMVSSEVVYDGEAILVNRGRLESLCLSER